MLCFRIEANIKAIKSASDLFLVLSDSVLYHGLKYSLDSSYKPFFLVQFRQVIVVVVVVVTLVVSRRHCYFLYYDNSTLTSLKISQSHLPRLLYIIMVQICRKNQVMNICNSV